MHLICAQKRLNKSKRYFASESVEICTQETDGGQPLRRQHLSPELPLMVVMVVTLGAPQPHGSP
jgi:hypothetical protein